VSENKLFDAAPSYHADVTADQLAEWLATDMKHIFDKAVIVFKERQQKYGSNNIARRGAAGVVVRLDDKLARLEQLLKGCGSESTDESIEDTAIDIINYAGIALLCLKGRWPAYKS
jgi:hypothetical protein